MDERPCWGVVVRDRRRRAERCAFSRLGAAQRARPSAAVPSACRPCLDPSWRRNRRCFRARKVRMRPLRLVGHSRAPESSVRAPGGAEEPRKRVTLRRQQPHAAHTAVSACACTGTVPRGCCAADAGFIRAGVSEDSDPAARPLHRVRLSGQLRRAGRCGAYTRRAQGVRRRRVQRAACLPATSSTAPKHT